MTDIIIQNATITVTVDNVSDTLDQILALLTHMEAEVMADLSALTADVTSNGDAVASATALLTGLKAALDAAGTDPAALAALSSSLEANTSALAAAVVANTPAQP